MKYFLSILLFVALGCGSQEEEQAASTQDPPMARTPFGSVEAVQTYLTQIDPFIGKVGQLHAAVVQQIGSAGRATSKNLATAMKEVRPQLQKALDDFRQIDPPPDLRAFHDDIKKLMETRLKAYDLTIDGWKREQKTEDTAWFEEAEGKLQEADDLILQLNSEMQKINLALQQVVKLPTQVASP
jgi:hypothetical protein